MLFKNRYFFLFFFSSRSPSLDNETLLAEIACMLIEAGANVNQIDQDHFTPLIYGIYK